MNAGQKHYFDFDEFRIEVETRRLTRNGQTVTLKSRDFDILLALVQNPGQTVDKNDLMETVWPDTFVEEGNLNRHVSTLRKILDDDPKEPRLIKTIPKRGYRFTADVRESVVSDETVSLENVTRSRVVISEETTEGFWTPRKLAVAAGVLGVAVLMGGFVMYSSNARASANLRAEAQENLRKGRALWNTRKAGDLHEATLLLEQAVQKDPSYAPAHAALADAYSFDYQNWKKAEAAANKAMVLDPALGEPHATLGFILMFWEWRLSDAEAEFKQAVALSPNYATGHQWFAASLAASQHNDAALTEIKKAAELEPLSVAISADYCRILYFARRYDEALAQCRNTLHLDPGLLTAHQLIYDIYSAKGMNDETVEKFIENEYMSNRKLPPEIGEKLREAYAGGGIREFRLAQIDYFLRTPDHYKAAQAYARLGEIEKASEALLNSYEKREFDLVFYIADPVFAELRPFEPSLLALGEKLRGQLQ